MKRFKQILLISIITILLITGIFIIFKKKPPVWTRINSLVSVKNPGPVDSGSAKTLIHAIDASLEYLNKIPPERKFHFGNDSFTASEMTNSLLDFKKHLGEMGLTEQFFNYIDGNYIFYKSVAKQVLFTGYYEAQLQGSTKPSQKYCYPIYRRPDDLLLIDLTRYRFYQPHNGWPDVLRGRLSQGRVIPYYKRHEIDQQQKLAGKHLEILWVDDPVALFFLQIQGSGIVQLDDQTKIRINYAESNGHPYRAIGRLLIDQGILTRENISMQSIRAYIDSHPEEREEIFNYNPSYVFFRTVERGPLGSLGVPLTPYRSIASDNKLFPKGSICYVKTEIPIFDTDQQITAWKPFSGFVLNQDTGGAIKSPARIDLFTGYGTQSELVAGHMKQQGIVYFLIKKRKSRAK